MTQTPTQPVSASIVTTHDRPVSLRESFDWCERVVRERARNFYYGLKLTPEPKRSAVYAIYAFMRACDDLADEAGLDEDPAEVLERIKTFRGDMERVLSTDHSDALPAGRYWPAFAHVARTYPIDPTHFHAMLDGQRADLEHAGYDTFEQLHDYCYHVASVVGLVCVAIWGHDGDSRVPQMAEDRGIALQLTNILRDLAEDAGRGRVYLPRQDLKRFGVTEHELKQGKASAQFDELMRYQIDRAREYYRRSAELESHIDPACRSTCWAMTRIYHGLLERIAANPRRVLTQRVRLGSWRKLGIASMATLKRTWSD